jgi:hypothetical protein
MRMKGLLCSFHHQMLSFVVTSLAVVELDILVWSIQCVSSVSPGKFWDNKVPERRSQILSSTSFS